MIHLITDDAASSRNHYLEEILSHAGLAWRRSGIAALDAGPSLIVVSGAMTLDADARGALERLVHDGAALIVTGGTAGLDDLLGTTSDGAHEGYLTEFDVDHPVTAGLPSPLHVFAAAPLRWSTGTPVASLTDTSAATITGAGVVVNRHGKGATVALAPDIAASVLTIQLGRPVHEDGDPAPDGTAQIDEGILKTDDGVVLSWEHDRIRSELGGPLPDCPGKDPAYPDGDTPWFGRPVADELRALLLQSIAWAASETGQSLALLAEWPDGIEAVGMISHDSDLNVDASAHTALRLLDEAGIRSTWCHMWGPKYPDRYLPETLPLVGKTGHEIALHYNALPQDGGAWGREHLASQAAFVRNEAGVEGFVSNKNHYLRWEGHVDFYHWLVDEGIQADQCKGPSKKGNVGYPHGSSLPWFPLDPATGAFIDVVEIPLQFQDLWLTTPASPSRTTIAQAKRHHGIAHFLFHQIHLHTRPEVAQAMLDVVAHGRDEGLAWWTSAEINHWERQRRTISLTREGDHIVIRTDAAVSGATIDIVLPRGCDWDAATLVRDGSELSVSPGRRWNQPTVTTTLDLPAGETVLTIRQ
jgi:hypothetical protein